MKWSSRDYYIAFNMIQGIGGRRLQALERRFHSLDEAWRAPYDELIKTPGLGEKTIRSFIDQRKTVCPAKEREWARGYGGTILTPLDSAYPQSLRSLAVPPPAIYCIGRIPEQLGIAIVGTRRPSRSGVQQAYQFGSAIAKLGFPVISGLARGIDKAAHEGSLKANGLTVAVLGSNIASIYPAEHRGLAKRIGQTGAVVSEFSSRSRTLPGNFPRRNRLIAGLSTRILVVEAGMKSGALNTADWALDQGKDVWAIPGAISDPLRDGTNWLIKQGAGLASSVDDVINGLVKDEVAPNQKLAIDRVAQLYVSGSSVNEISSILKLPINEVLAQITRLQVQGVL